MLDLDVMVTLVLCALQLHHSNNKQKQLEPRGRTSERCKIMCDMLITMSCFSLSYCPKESMSITMTYVVKKLKMISSPTTQKLDLTDNPDLVMPPKPQTELKGTGAEFYNINFDPSILRTGAVVTTSTAVKSKLYNVLVYVTSVTSVVI